jgi:DNA-binding MarR family transcriptional regulator
MPTVIPSTEAAKLREMTTHCACLNARKAARLLSQLYDAALRPVGVRSTQLPLLATLGLRGPLTLSELADAVVIDRTTLTRSLLPLEQHGWVRSTPGDDLRMREISLTPRGREVLRRAIPLWQQAQTRVMTSLGGDLADRIVTDFAATVEVMKELQQPVPEHDD